MTQKNIQIEALLKWAYCEELPKSTDVGQAIARMASGWSSMNSFAQLLTVIDDNDYGVVPDLS
ncbi:MAG: hypothetical protein ABJH19_07485, partial [Roseibium sp.]